MAIADATMQYLVETVQCKTLFITHYPLVASKLQARFPDDVENLHMGYHADSHIDSTRSIMFLYRLTEGMATGSWLTDPSKFNDLSNLHSCRVIWHRMWPFGKNSRDHPQCGFQTFIPIARGSTRTCQKEQVSPKSCH